MNRNTTPAKAMSYVQQCAKEVCWSSEWSFVEEADAVELKPLRPALATKNSTGNHTASNTKPQ